MLTFGLQSVGTPARLSYSAGAQYQSDECNLMAL